MSIAVRACRAFKFPPRPDTLVPNRTRQGSARKRTLKLAGHFLARGAQPAAAALITKYQTQRPDQAMLQAKLHGFYALHMPAEGREQP